MRGVRGGLGEVLDAHLGLNEILKIFRRFAGFNKHRNSRGFLLYAI